MIEKHNDQHLEQPTSRIEVGTLYNFNLMVNCVQFSKLDVMHGEP